MAQVMFTLDPDMGDPSAMGGHRRTMMNQSQRYIEYEAKMHTDADKVCTLQEIRWLAEAHSACWEQDVLKRLGEGHLKHGQQTNLKRPVEANVTSDRQQEKMLCRYNNNLGRLRKVCLMEEGGHGRDGSGNNTITKAATAFIVGNNSNN